MSLAYGSGTGGLGLGRTYSTKDLFGSIDGGTMNALVTVPWSRNAERANERFIVVGMAKPGTKDGSYDLEMNMLYLRE